MKRYLVTGGAGFIGSTLVDRLLAEGHEVDVVDDLTSGSMANLAEARGNPDHAFQLHRLDVRDAAVAGLIERRRPEVVFHLAAQIDVRASVADPGHDASVNVLGTITVAGAACRAGARKIVFASSGGTVYGVPVEVPIREDHPTQPQVSYGICKLMIEKYLGLFTQLHGLRPVSLRIANPYGGRQRIDTAQGAVAVFLHRALHREPVEIWGDGSVVRDYLHVADVANAISAALGYEGRHQVMNIGAGRGLSLNGLLDEIEALLGRKVDRRYLAGRGFDVPVSVLDISLARAELDWTPRISLKDGLRLTLAAQDQ